MALGVTCPNPILQFWLNNGQLAAGGSILTQVGGINAATYQDSALVAPLPNPIPLNSRGEISNAVGTSSQLFLTPNTVYIFTLFDAGGNQIWQAAYVNGVQVAAFTQSNIGAVFYPQTAIELAAGVTPINFWYPPGNVFRYYSTAQIAQTQAFSSAPTLDCSAAINTAVKCTSGDVFFPTGIHYINAPIYIPSTAISNVRFVGESRTNTKIEPMANNIADPIGINAMIINQVNNEKFSLYRIRLTTGDDVSVSAWAGFSLHAVQPTAWSATINFVAGAVVTNAGSTYICIAANINQAPPNASFWVLSAANSAGLTAATCNYIFSGSIRDCWLDAGGVQPFFVGGLNNYLVSDNTFEFQKGCFSITGGTADAHFVHNSVNNSFDYFLQMTMVAGAGINNGNVITVQGLHVYTHNRGLLFQCINCWSMKFFDVTLQAFSGAVVGNGIGIGSFVGVTDLEIRGINVLTNSTLTTGPTGTQLTFQTCTGVISDCIFDGVDIGILLTGTSNNRLSFDHVDIVNAITACFRVNGGNPGGLIEVSDSNWSDCQQNNVIFTTAATFDMHMKNVRLLNAGLDGNAGRRNLSPATSGLFRMTDGFIGQNNVLAVAQYYIEGAGSGDFLLVDPNFIGVPPTGVQNPGASQQASIGAFTVPYSASMTFSVQYWDEFVITATNATAFTINSPTSAIKGKRITVVIRNTSGGALGVVTWNAVFKLSTWTQPANGNSRSIDYRFDGSNWIQIGQTGVDVPN